MVFSCEMVSRSPPRQIKKKVFSGEDFYPIDPYLMLFERVQKFFQNAKSANEIDALRIAFYMKTGVRIDSTSRKWSSWTR